MVSSENRKQISAIAIVVVTVGLAVVLGALRSARRSALYSGFTPTNEEQLGQNMNINLPFNPNQIPPPSWPTKPMSTLPPRPNPPKYPPSMQDLSVDDVPFYYVPLEQRLHRNHLCFCMELTSLETSGLKMKS
jgi:hypothetical protein